MVVVVVVVVVVRWTVVVLMVVIMVFVPLFGIQMDGWLVRSLQFSPLQLC